MLRTSGLEEIAPGRYSYFARSNTFEYHSPYYLPLERLSSLLEADYIQCYVGVTSSNAYSVDPNTATLRVTTYLNGSKVSFYGDASALFTIGVDSLYRQIRDRARRHDRSPLRYISRDVVIIGSRIGRQWRKQRRTVNGAAQRRL